MRRQRVWRKAPLVNMGAGMGQLRGFAAQLSDINSLRLMFGGGRVRRNELPGNDWSTKKVGNAYDFRR